MTVKRKSAKNTAAHRYCMDDETLFMSLVIYPGRQGSKMNLSQEACLISVNSFGGGDITWLKQTVAYVKVKERCRKAVRSTL